ncbi:MAG: helix-turn-helix transcriptional regulator [Neomegalonema sp.]|nr:helix-turn-helix transcriptional regulator [Neomegalonema sp.]
MASARRYQLLCPIARALDRVGDRWTLLILRDLHAGPARFSDLAAGLPGAASNLLTTRLQQLIEDGIIQKNAGLHGLTTYELTETGKRTGSLLFELARFGASFEPDEETKKTGNRRLIAVTLAQALERSAPRDAQLHAALTVDDDNFDVRLECGAASVRLTAKADAPIRLSAAYEAIAAVTDGRMPLEIFAADHLRAAADAPELLSTALPLFAGALAEIAGASAG